MGWFKTFWSGFTTPLSSDIGNTGTQTNFTPHAQQVLALARKEADRFNHNFVGTESLLLGLIRLREGVAVKVLQKLGVDLETLRIEVEKQVGSGPDQKMTGGIPYTPRVKKVLVLAANEAKNLNHVYVGTEHILLGLLREGDGVAARVLKNLDVDINQTRQEILNELDPNLSSTVEGLPMTESEKSGRKAVDVTKRYDIYCKDHEREVVYRNALMKGVRTLFKTHQFEAFSEFMELEQSNGQTIFISRHSISKFCEPGVTPGPEVVTEKRKEQG